MSSQVLSIRALKNRPRAAEALDLLKKIASLVKPIMKKHGWTLPELVEFFPENPSLLGLNVNQGQKICIRLRPAFSPDSFLPLEPDLIGTMLHELTHNVHGPHDQAFYTYLDKLNDEYETLRTSGYSGEGFQSDGKRLGQGVANDRGVSLDMARQKAADMAEKRIKLQGILGTQGRRLGGSKGPTKSPREMAAEAAERRLKDSKSCGLGDENLSDQMKKEIDRASAEATERHIIDLDEGEVICVGESQPKPIPPLSSRPSTSTFQSPQLSNRPQKPKSANVFQTAPQNIDHKILPPIKSSWTCDVCTFINDNPLALQCDVCTNIRSSNISLGTHPSDDDGWFCHMCGLKNDHKFWSCAACQTIKLTS